MWESPPPDFFGWGLVEQINKDPALKSAIHAVAVHYPAGKIPCSPLLWTSPVVK